MTLSNYIISLDFSVCIYKVWMTSHILSSFKSENFRMTFLTSSLELRVEIWCLRVVLMSISYYIPHYPQEQLRSGEVFAFAQNDPVSLFSEAHVCYLVKKTTTTKKNFSLVSWLLDLLLLVTSSVSVPRTLSLSNLLFQNSFGLRIQLWKLLEFYWKRGLNRS